MIPPPAATSHQIVLKDPFGRPAAAVALIILARLVAFIAVAHPITSGAGSWSSRA